MTSRLTEKLSGARLIKAFRLEDYAARRVNENFEQVFQLRMKAVRARARVGPLLEAVAGLTVAGAIAFAYWRISGGASTVGDFLGFVAALLLAAQSIKSLGNVSNATMEGLAAADRIYELLDEKPTVVDRPGAQPACNQHRHHRRSTMSASPIARPRVRQRSGNFSLTVPGGKTAALVGRSGAGKSTIINLVARLFDVQTGSITIDGQDLRDTTLASLRNSIAIVSQEVTLFDDTIRANIALGKLGASEESIVAAAKAAAAHEFIMAQPKGYETVIGESGLRLSGGQRQRLALARAILKDAPILLLDEATSALDTESERLVQEALGRFTRNRTTLVIAHRLSTVQRADVICLMKDGRMVEVGTARRTPRPRRRLCAAVPLADPARSGRNRTHRRGTAPKQPELSRPYFPLHFALVRWITDDWRRIDASSVCSGWAIEVAIPTVVTIKPSRQVRLEWRTRSTSPSCFTPRSARCSRATCVSSAARRGKRGSMTERFDRHSHNHPCIVTMWHGQFMLLPLIK